MRLTAFTDYTLRTLIYLALRPAKLVTIADIATAYDVSANHLMKVVHQLAQTGDIETVRGQRGGLRLARPPEDPELVACFGEGPRCVIQEGCVLQHALDDALQAFLGVLDRYTLADLVTPRQSLAGWLGMAEPPEQRIV
jgi:Rrf2 family transcriptional regulator, nitric oxide-sensitive transcriptional repressor